MPIKKDNRQDAISRHNCLRTHLQICGLFLAPNIELESWKAGSPFSLEYTGVWDRVPDLEKCCNQSFMPAWCDIDFFFL